MQRTLAERTLTWIHATFPERQIYIRSDGRVQFFTFSPVLQATMAGLSLFFLGWVAFASVNVMFKDHIIAAKDHRYQQMQATYETRVADLQVSYDELQGALVSAEDKFKSTADELEAKQHTVASLLNHQPLVDSTLSGISGDMLGTDAGDIPRAHNANTAGDSIGAVPWGAPDGAVSPGSSVLSVMPDPAPAPPRTAHLIKASFLDDTIGKLAGALFRRSSETTTHNVAIPNNPAFHVLLQQTARVRRLSASETALLQGVDRQFVARVDSLEGVMRRVGINPATFEGSAKGGPDVPLQDVRVDGISDPAFTAAYVGASAHGKELDALYAGLKQVPLTTPVHGHGFELTSDFGPRVDPFTHRVSFHPGDDFAGAWGSVVTATAPGIVTFAAARGGYGNMVEIDHGYGMRTRYGHLSSLLVGVGAKVGKGAPVGKLGSTGRSTGPHVHYEVWLADVARDPSRFIEAGRHVLQQE